MQAMQQQGAQMFSQSLMKSLQDNAKIEDYRKYGIKLQAQ